MKRKLGSLLLALVFACRLALPAFAADTEPPMWQQFGYESREAFCEAYSDYDPDTAQMVPLSDAEYDEIATLYGERLAFIQSGGDFWSEEGYDSYEEWYAEYQGWYAVDEAEFERQMALTYAQSEHFRRETEREIAEERAALGLTPGGVGLLLDGEALPFAGEYANESTYAPVRALAEALGGEAGFEAETQTVTVTRGDMALSFPLGSATMTVEDGGGEARAVQLPAPVYERGGSSYIPVRAFGEALGLTVGWDERFEAAVLLDRAALTAGIDEDFTCLNRVFASQQPRDAGKVYRTVLAAAGTVTMFDTINGDEALPVAADMTVVSEGESFSLDAQLDLRAVMNWLAEESENSFSYFEEMMQQMRELLADLRVQVIVDYDADTVYLRSPQLVGLLVKNAGETAVPEGAAALSADAWYMVKDAGLRSEAAQEASRRLDELFGGNAASAGELVYAQALAMQWGEPDAYFCETLEKQARELRMFVGDARFTEEGGTVKLSLDSSKLGESEDDEALAQSLELAGIRRFTAECTITASGKVTAKVEAHQKPAYGTETLLTLRASGDRDRAEADLAFHLKNTMEVKLHLELSVAAQQEKPSFRPPEGAQIIDLNAIRGL